MSRWKSFVRSVVTIAVVAAVSLLLATAAVANEKYLQIPPFDGQEWAMHEGPICDGEVFRIYREPVTEEEMGVPLSDGWYRYVSYYLVGADWPFLVVQMSGVGIIDHMHIGTSGPLTVEQVKKVYFFGPCQIANELLEI